MNNNEALSGFQNISNIFDSLRRHLVAFTVIFLTVTPAIIAGGTFLPKRYRAYTTILVEPQKIPQDYVRSLVSVPVEERLRTITQQVTSRSRLLKIINGLNLAPTNISSLKLEEMIKNMQKQIDVEVKGTDYFQITYTGKDPRTVMLITNKIASLFIEENLKVSERLAQTTTTFISEELKAVKDELELQETRLQEFKQQHMGELPGQEEANLRTLDRLQLQLQNNDQALRDAEEQVMSLQNQLVGERPFETLAQTQQNPALNNLLQLKSELAVLKSRYSDEWPRVKQIKEEIAELETKLKTKGNEPKEPVPEETRFENPVYRNIKQNLETTKIRVQGLKRAKKKLRGEIYFYRKKVENIPETEQQLISLTRDYEMTKSKYESLLNKKLEAKLSESLESKQKGETFKILDAAEIPLKPYSPNLIGIIFSGIGAGLALAVGFVWLKESTDTSLKNVDDCENYFGIPSIGIISNIQTAADIRRKRWKMFVLVIFLTLYMAAIFLAVKNRLLIKQRIFSINNQKISSSMFQ